MKNHYFTPYPGNKRKEIQDILPLIDLDNIKYIIEPFAGSAVMSYYITTLYPNKFKYILNDNDKINYDLYNISRDTERTDDFNYQINKIIDEFNTYTEDAPRRIFYFSIKKMDTIEAKVFIEKAAGFRPGIYPLISKMKNIKPYKLEDHPIYDFYNNEDITYENIDGIEIIIKYNENDDKLFLIDPPYLKTCNDFYRNKDVNIYEWAFHNSNLLLNSKNKIILILERMWIITLLLKPFNILLEYGKRYELTKKKTTHIVYSN